MRTPIRDVPERALALVALTAIGAGALLHALDAPGAGDAVWAALIALMLVPLTISVARTLARGDVGVDAIALIAMAGALVLGEYLAGAVIALMLSGGNALEAYAGRRARRELTALLERAPKIAHVHRDGELEEVAVEAVMPGDVLFVRAGEVLPVDGVVLATQAVVDESSLTGESLPVARAAGEPVRSGAANAGDAFDMRATRPASESAYAAIVRLVREAERQRAPFVRMADRYAAIFLPVTAAVAGAAWAISGDSVRALAVFVVATPCPLILAAPIALISGVSRAARRGVIVKGAGVIERLGGARTILLDKTGTLTVGTPEVEHIVALNSRSDTELLTLAASVDQLSAHVLAEALVHDAQGRGLELAFPRDVAERPGQGIEGTVDGHRVTVGSSAWLEERGYEVGHVLEQRVDEDGDGHTGRARILVGVDGRLAGAIVMGDRLREDAGELVKRLRGAGDVHVAMVTGDRRAVAEEIARQAGLDAVYAEQTPEGKVEVVRAIAASPERRTVVMVGDGVNDAPALASADVGIAMGAAGATVSAETADAVIVVDAVDRVADAVRIGRRSLRIARQSVIAGMALSGIAMIFAALGQLPPVEGALLQEGIDVAVIVNALRALR